MGLFGILLGLALLIWLAYRGWSILLLAPAAALIAAAFAGGPLLAYWNWSGIITFALAFFAAQAREARDESWSLTLEDWLPSLGLSREQWAGMLLPWAASLAAGEVISHIGARPETPLAELLLSRL